MITDYDEDAHFCLKCHETIIGLENYVSHRKTGCSKTINVVEIPKSPLPSQLLPPDESFTLKADDFFSSLELQSSSKKAPVPSTSGKTFSGILTRSKTSAVIQACNSSKDNPTELQQSKSGKNAWIGGHQLKELGTGDNQTKLIKAVDNLSRNACLKKVDIPPDIGVYDSDDDSDETDFDDDEYEDDEDAPPRSFTGGKWKPSSPISEWNEPPPNFTGGKWKPKSQRIQLLPPANHTKGKWKPDSPLLKDGYDAIPSPSFTGSKWTAAKARNEYGDVPPPSHTKGKWKPGKEKALRSENEDSNETFPPPSHTKGKWKPLDKKVIETNKQKQPVIKNEIEKRKISEESPPFRKSNGGVQYWCRPCNRRLASKIVYERHLKSELHLKRTVHESEFDDSSDLNTNLDKETKKTIRKPVEYWSHTTAEDNKDTMKNTTQTTKRIRRKIYEKCEVCRSRVTSQMMGKHLISHYHCRKGDITLPEAKKMVLDNIHNIVLQSPYQCGTCKFYCNTQSYFLQHWNSEGHKINISKQYGYIWCIFCKFSAADNNSMFTHLTSTEHNEVISAINRSVPIIIKKISPIKCKTCSQSFLLNFQLRKHCEKHKHEPNRTSTDEYQNKQKCSLCENIFKSKVALQRHISSAHKSKLFFCSSCSVQFKTQEEINAHRKTVEHRYSVDSKSKTKQKAYKKCEYCEELFENILFLKKHLKEKHPEHTHNCPHCGEKFIVPQDVTVHVRSKSCTFFKMPKKNQCDKCLYGTDTISELLFHKSLHNEPLIVTGNAKQPQKHYKCPLCDRHYPKVSLRFHIQNHTNEKAYSCNLCDAKFARKNNWKFHIKNHGKDRKKISAKEPTDRSYLCATCGTSFSKNSTLQKHMLTHGGKKFKCTEPNCIHLARTSAELKIHIKTHSSEKNYQCDRCDYRGKTKQQLRRHMTVHEETKKFKCPHCSFTTRLGFHLRRHERVHTGSKPYACPHCEYRSNNLENLRKHVLSTNKHPGQCIYECKFCEEGQFQSNFAKDFKVHLISEHGDVFESGTEAAGYISGIYDGMAEDAPPPPPPLPPSPLKETDIENVQLEETTDELMKPEGNYENKELFPMYIVAKDEVVCVDKDTWSMVASFDVEESGALVSFNEEGETFFQEHFQ